VTCISTNRFLNALESSFLPPYIPVGFCVANSWNPGCAFIVVCVSGTKSSRLSSRTLLRASSTSVGARLSSSSISQCPLRIASHSIPKKEGKSFRCYHRHIGLNRKQTSYFTLDSSVAPVAFALNKMFFKANALNTTYGSFMVDLNAPVSIRIFEFQQKYLPP